MSTETNVSEQQNGSALEAARELLKREYGSGKPETLRGYDTRAFGRFIAFGQSELDQLNAVRELVLRYLEQRSPPRPLCVAVFGPPGSGKSFAVRQIRDVVEKLLVNNKLKLPIITLNLTQVSHPSELGRVLGRVAGEQDEDTVP
ncbi:MAG TPA: hypothetical protein VF541_01235, partial [Longimicrobium sp.]